MHKHSETQRFAICKAKIIITQVQLTRRIVFSFDKLNTLHMHSPSDMSILYTKAQYTLH